MIEKTGTAVAPWVLVEANNKEWARVKVIKAVVQHVKDAPDDESLKSSEEQRLDHPPADVRQALVAAVVEDR